MTQLSGELRPAPTTTSDAEGGDAAADSADEWGADAPAATLAAAGVKLHNGLPFSCSRCMRPTPDSTWREWTPAPRP